jgi:hypothetical protein
MKKRTLILVTGAIAIATAAGFITRSSWMGGSSSAQAPQRPRTVSVELAKAERKSVPVDVDANGTVTPISSVALKSRLETTIVAVHFEDGAKVNQGDLLFTLDSRQIDAQIEQAEGVLAANAPAPGKRPRSSMSPTIVLDADGDFVLATGSPGGNSIVAYTAKTLVAMLDWGLSPEEAAALPNVVARGDVVSIETGFDDGILAGLEELGHQVRGQQGENSGIHIIRRQPDGSLLGGADPRRDGVSETP